MEILLLILLSPFLLVVFIFDIIESLISGIFYLFKLIIAKIRKEPIDKPKEPTEIISPYAPKIIMNVKNRK